MTHNDRIRMNALWELLMAPKEKRDKVLETLEKRANRYIKAHRGARKPYRGSRGIKVRKEA